MLCILLCVSFSWAFSSGQIKQRMIERKPEIDNLKDKGLVGENNRGYLEALKQLTSSQSSLLEAENADREKVYTAIARQMNTSVELVGKHRAAQIEKISEKGHWLQDARGTWYQKSSQ